ncbi:MAG TPA: hypothetical protein VKL22_07390, partial [Actinomycetota bacterium]|nr:hypothetical protein [Actinomycetota bacterium]
DADRGSTFGAGACPSIDYQVPHGGKNKLKTLETDSNYIKAGLLLYQITNDTTYLKKAEGKYAAVRQWFLDPAVPLYTVYVFDDGSTCSPLHGRYFGSVNGNMIWAGYHLAGATGNSAYHDDAVATARAVQQYLGDATGVYADLQAENDVSEPLVEAMYELASLDRQAFARDWLLRAADASASDINPNKTYGRFFDGPGPQAAVTAWQANGGLVLQHVAAALDPKGVPSHPGRWSGAAFVADDLSVTDSPVQFTFTGQGVAVIGTIGEQCCESGHAKVFIDGTQTFDRTGIWQNKSSSGRSLPNSVLFAWRWPSAGTHTIQIQPGVPNAKEGTSFFHMVGYYLAR